jgi:hypothetical protein
MSEKQRFETVVVAMAAALRDKYDFSDDNNYAELAERAVKSAKAIIAKVDEVYPEIFADKPKTEAKK